MRTPFGIQSRRDAYATASDRSNQPQTGDRTLPFVIPRACDFFDLFVFFAPDQMFFSPLQKGVILSEAPRRSIA